VEVVALDELATAWLADWAGDEPWPEASEATA
jgi:hypothetical protein